MPTEPHSPISPSEHPEKKLSLSEKVTRPRTMLKLIGLMSLLIIGLGVMAAIVQQSQKSTDSRSQASAPTEKTIYFGDTSLFDVSAPVTVPVSINAGRPMSAVSFALDYDSDEVASITFSPTNAANFDTQTETSSVNSEGGKRVFFMVTPLVPTATSFLSGNLGNLTITFTPEFVARTYVTTNVSFVPNNVATKLPNQAVPVDSSSEIFVLNPGSPLAMRTGGGGPTPTVNPSITAPLGINSPGALWYCPALNCADGGTTVPLWIATDSARTTITVPASAKLLRYNVTTVVPPATTGWQPVMRTEVPGRPVAFVNNGPIAYAGTMQQPLGDSEWPVTLSTNVRKNVGSNPTMVYNCSTRLIVGSNPPKQEFGYYRLGDPTNQYLVSGGCTNQTRIVVHREGEIVPSVTPTPSVGVTATLTPTSTSTPTPTPPTAALRCPIPSPLGVAPTVTKVTVDGQLAFRLKWSNVLAGSSGRYGIYLVNDAGKTPYYLYDVVNNTNVLTGSLMDPTLSILPDPIGVDYMKYTWRVPPALQNREFYRFLVYARLNDGTRVCSNQAVLGRWPN